MSFLTDYLTVTSGNESPLAYHLWSGLSALSTAAGRRFFFPLGHLEYYCNLYVLLVGEPGVKKSSAMNIAKQMVQLSEICPIAANQTTREFFSKAMSGEKFKGKKHWKDAEGQTHEYNQYAVYATEFTQFISVNPEGMLEFLTAIYDEKIHSADYKNQGSDMVIGPYITLLGCLTPHMLKGYLKMNVLTGGFARRTVFVYGFEESIIPIPTFTDEQRAAGRRCVEFIKKLQDRSGVFHFGPGAKEWYEEWYTRLRRNIKDIAKPNTEGYYRSKHELLFKVSMLLALSDEGPLELLPQHFEIAEEKFFAPVDKHLERVFEGTGINPTSQASMQICRMLEAMRDPIDKKKILALFYDAVPSLRDLEDTLRHLCLVGRLREMPITVGGTLIGTLIGTPGAFSGRNLADLAKLLQPPPSLPGPSETGQS